MANPIQSENPEPDFSKFFDVDETLPTEDQIPGSTPPARPFMPKRMKILVGILILAAIGLSTMLVIRWTATMPPIPDGYHLVTPPNQPARLEKN
jgi:hypothetical protein